MPETIHLRPTAALAPRVLLPGDPGRALLLAQTLLDEPKMFNHNRGLWGYTGAAADGEQLTIQASGMGRPSAMIVAEELVALGAERIVRVGTCGALAPGVGLGELVVVEVARHGGAELTPDAALAAALDGEHRGPVVSSDEFYDPDLERQQAWADAGALAVEMECFGLFHVAARHGVAAAALLLVSDIVLPWAHAAAGGGSRERIGDEALREGEERLGRAALAAL
jgi:purine-nucleoside phosphorylase